MERAVTIRTELVSILVEQAPAMAAASISSAPTADALMFRKGMPPHDESQNRVSLDVTLA